MAASRFDRLARSPSKVSDRVDGGEWARRGLVDVRSPGWWLELLGVGHLAVGAVLHHEQLAEMIRGGLVATAGEGATATAWWFVVLAPATWSAGRLMRALERAEPPAAAMEVVGRVLAATGLVGGVVLPASPFWVLAAVGAAAARSASTWRDASGRGAGPDRVAVVR